VRSNRAGCTIRIMKSIKKYWSWVVFSVFWFALLPFPFERFDVNQIKSTVWVWLGGYHWFVTFLGVGSASTVEENDALYHYAKHWYLAAFMIVCLILGWITYKAVKVAAGKN